MQVSTKEFIVNVVAVVGVMFWIPFLWLVGGVTVIDIMILNHKTVSPNEILIVGEITFLIMIGYMLYQILTDEDY